MKILCTKDFHMEDGERSFTAGKTYEFTFDFGAWEGIDDQGDKHFMDESDLEELQE